MALLELIEKSEKLWTLDEEKNVINVLRNWKIGVKKNNVDYRIHRKYVLKKFAGVVKVVTKKSNKIVATKESVLNIIKDLHEGKTIHKGQKKTYLVIKELYSNISREIVIEYVKQCERCVEKLRLKEKTGIVVRPIIATDFNQRGQIDLVDYQSSPDGDYKFIFHYVDHLSKYHFLRPLKNKTAAGVAEHLFKIFIDFGCPQILQSDNGREFTANVIKVKCILWSQS